MQIYMEGTTFKDTEAFFNHPNEPCYSSELSDVAYTHQDFLDLFNGQEEIAELCFDTLEWKDPATWYEEAICNEEIAMCPHCKKLYLMYGETCPCPVCGSMPE